MSLQPSPSAALAVRPGGRSPRIPQALRRAGWVVAAPALAAAVVSLDPAAVGLSTTAGFLHVVSFRSLAALGFLGAGVLGGLSLLLPRTGRPWLRLTATAVAVLVGLGHGAVVVERGWAGTAAPGRADLTVVGFNTLKSGADPAAIAALVLDADAQMVAMPEMVRARAQKVADRLAAAGRSYQVFSTSVGSGLTETTSLLVRSDLGEYRQVAGPDLTLGAVRVVPVSGRGPTLVAVHAGAPVSAVGYRRWAQDVAGATAQCVDTPVTPQSPGAVVAGDFNATVDHGALADLGDCQDAASAAGRGAEGTWPSWVPAPFAAPIDHVLVSRAGYRVLSTRTLRVSSSDHRALVARLSAIPGS